MVPTKVCILLAVGVALTAVQAAPIVDNSNITPSLNNKCVLTAAGILNDMDALADPCQDFNQFVCGGFENKNVIPSGDYGTGATSILYYSNMRILRSILDPSLGRIPKPAPGDIAEQNNIKKLLDMFSSCMDEEAIFKAGRKPLADEIQRLIKSFPASASPSDRNTLTLTMAQFSRLGFSLPPLFQLLVGPDHYDPITNILHIKESGLAQEPAFDYRDVEQIRFYRNTAAVMFQSILGDEDVGNRTQPLTPEDIKSEWSDVAKDVVEFEIQLAAIAEGPSTPDNWYIPYTVEQLNVLTPSIDWSLLLGETLPAGINYTRPIKVDSVSYLTGLDALLQTTSSKTLQHYFSWIYIQNHADYIAAPYKRPLMDYKNSFIGISLNAKIEPWETCVDIVHTNLDQLVGHYFVMETFKDNTRQEVMTIIDNILTSYEKDFAILGWLDKLSRDGAIEKLNNIVQTVGYSTESPDLMSSKFLDEYYRNYTVSASDHFSNQVQYTVSSAVRKYTQLPLPVNRKAVRMAQVIPNAYYDPLLNSINFLAGLLQPPFFHVGNPEYVNYGAFGTTAGHEVGHGFGNMYAIGASKKWWTNTTEEAFIQKTQCFVEQYGNFTIKGPGGEDYNVDGYLTLGENLADNGGVKMSFRAWQSRITSDLQGKRIKNFKLPGLEKYTLEQLFFISYGRNNCDKVRPEGLLRMVQNDVHSPSKWRINGVAQNSPDFAMAFKCKAGSPMNPINKCEVW
ncbi:MAG: hypothetical protein J3R72DRAFT_512589 [Linnemannia gamsii]|nr:MAG: hypothetical protein J3R72DRAFT_512589 [Linnemannia gamsii]